MPGFKSFTSVLSSATELFKKGATSISPVKAGFALMGTGAAVYGYGKLKQLDLGSAFHTAASFTDRPATKTFSKAIGTGALAGGIAVGTAAAVFLRRPDAAVLGFISGAAAGGYSGWKLATGTSRAISQAGQAYFGVGKNPQQQANQVYGFGPGYRTWYKRPGGPLQPGHLGADGSLPLALHRIRNRSIRR